jgi:hypothetical protein
MFRNGKRSNSLLLLVSITIHERNRIVCRQLGQGIVSYFLGLSKSRKHEFHLTKADLTVRRPFTVFLGL